ncbi:MAG TPA: RNA polymerase sigma-70 factor [Jiangellaceae bacterium]|nr:RNA polymerase sigma-70 factor [Jiangellaceae bacterium]
MPTLASHDDLRPLMFSIAYRMLGSVSEAEDIVQDAYLRLHSVGADEVDSPSSYAATVTTRLAIDHLRSARVRRESYVGPWLPEPLLATGPSDDPAARTEQRDTLSTAFLVLLETLSPIERAVFLLRDVFGYEFAEISTIVAKSESNCRQILSRARRRIEERRPRFEADPAQRDELARRFLLACTTGDLAGLEQLLADDVVFIGDGGGKAPAIVRPMYGRVQVARFVLGLFRQAERFGATVEPVHVGGHPAAEVLDSDGRILAVLSIDVLDGRIRGLSNVINPDKLGHLGPVGDITTLLGAR